MQVKERKVSQEQIDRLYLFTREHFVEYYDLQTELVDHLANAIEQQWRDDPALSFDRALKIEFSKFGVFGFMEVVESRQSAMRLKYDKIIFSIFRQFFQVPNIIATFAFMGLMFIFLKFIPFPEYAIIGLIGLFYVCVGWKMVRQRQKRQKAKKRWLFHEIIYSYGSASVAFMIIFYTFLHLPRYVRELDYTNNLVAAVASAIIVLIGVYAYIVLHYIPKKSEQYLQEVYPEYKFAN